MKKTFGIMSSLSIKIGIVIVLLLVVGFFSLRIDFSKDKAYSLSRVSKEAMRALEDVMVVKIVSSPSLPASMNTLERYTNDLLREYASASRGKFRYEYAKPRSRDELYQLAQNSGLSRIRFQIFENDQMITKEVIFGLIFEYKGEEQSMTLIPQMEPRLEYELTLQVQALAAHTVPRVAVFRDSSYYDFKVETFEHALFSNYHVYDANLSEPLIYTDALLFTGTARDISENQLYNLDQYIMQGGKVVFLQDKVDTDGSQLFSLDTNVIKLLAHYGFELSDDVVLDTHCDIRQYGLGDVLYYPMYPVLRGSSHPITRNMDNIVMYLASGISFGGKSDINFEPILQSSAQSGWMKAPEFEIKKELFQDLGYQDFTAGPITTAAILNGSFDSYFAKSRFAETDSNFVATSPQQKMVLFGDKELVIDSDKPIYDGRSNVVLNALDYLLGRDSMIRVRSHHLSTSLLSVPRFMQRLGIAWGDMEKIENKIKIAVKVIAIVLPPLILIVIGLLLALKRKLKQKGYHENN
ncbi:MAG: Gldg family protein [Candidatus Cloacimonadaceae bacterium]|jgi:gliding-associated putative ABC transporter substrate-binding component GldG|nr:Gldg family protein [Candidatus Cloacimonadota bacterium]MDY0127644.1 Gldg family protein [Candidatus Cloacimonadaceae bacterium]MCB5254385.1 Gldg family protein [Candidatus Cloacimonadota bacterium]MCK9178189.1 Gldg family protein [Candidatus Cloacimonadota bacterium]MCK9241989.1 Gldg family protein [Candidatus Cloacimonadota bacterium]